MKSRRSNRFDNLSCRKESEMRLAFHASSCTWAAWVWSPSPLHAIAPSNHIIYRVPLRRGDIMRVPKPLDGAQFSEIDLDEKVTRVNK